MSRNVMGLLILAGIAYGGYWVGKRTCAGGR
jgi:hypothetical protein